MLIYVDSSLLLDDILDDRPFLPELVQRAELATSQITSLEIARTLRRDTEETDFTLVSSQLLSSFDLLAITPLVLDAAAGLPVRFLRALDAIHLASAFLVQADVVLTRDRQMQRACEELGLAVA
jgi:predicted nucleic acid-binding protein